MRPAADALVAFPLSGGRLLSKVVKKFEVGELLVWVKYTAR